MDFIINNGSLVKYCGKGGNVVVPDGVINIYKDVFANMTKLASVFLPDSVRNIGPGAFRNCTNLTDVILGTNIDYGFQNAFEGCDKLKELHIRCGKNIHRIPFYPPEISNSNSAFIRPMVTGCCGPDSVYLYDGHTLWICGTGIVKPLFSLLRVLVSYNFSDYNDIDEVINGEGYKPSWYDEYGFCSLNEIQAHTLHTDKDNKSCAYDFLRTFENRYWAYYDNYPERKSYNPHGCFPDERDLWYVKEVRIQDGITGLDCGALNPLFAEISHEAFNCVSGEGLYGPKTVYVPQSLHHIGSIPYNVSRMGSVFVFDLYNQYGNVDCGIDIFGSKRYWGWMEQIAGQRYLSEMRRSPLHRFPWHLWTDPPIKCGRNATTIYRPFHKQLVISGIGLVSDLNTEYVPAKTVIIEDGISQLSNDVQLPNTVKVVIVPKDIDLPWPENSQKYKILRRGVNKFCNLRCLLGI